MLDCRLCTVYNGQIMTEISKAVSVTPGSRTSSEGTSADTVSLISATIRKIPIVSQESGFGQVGAGVVRPPMKIFEEALVDFAEKDGI